MVGQHMYFDTEMELGLTILLLTGIVIYLRLSYKYTAILDECKTRRIVSEHSPLMSQHLQEESLRLRRNPDHID